MNPDGSLAEMSGNGTRIAAAWLMDRTGSDIARVHVGQRAVEVRRVGERLYESELGEVEVHEPERIAGLDVTTVSVGNPHAVVVGDPADLPAVGPLLETPSALSEPHERAGRPHRRAGGGDRACLGARRGRDERLGLERGGGRGGDAQRGRGSRALSRAATCACVCTRAAPRSPVLRSPCRAAVRADGGNDAADGEEHGPESEHDRDEDVGIHAPCVPYAPISYSRSTSFREVFRSVFALRLPMMSAQPIWNVPAGNSFGRVPGTTIECGGT